MFSSISLTLSLGLLLAIIQSPALAEPNPAPRESPSRHALLIAIEDYQDSDFIPLKGPTNDLALVRQVLEDRFAVPAANILTLVDGQATHTGIRQAFADLAARIAPGDFVYVHYAGHGSQAEDKNGDEPSSGRDQTWVSYGARSGKLQGIDDYDVLDDEINEWLLPLYAKTEQVVFVSDSCHSATVTRGRITGLRAASTDPRPHPLAAADFKIPAARPGIRIGAARDQESAGEITDEQGQSYGLFTWYWVKTLNQAVPGETWNDVFKRAYALVTNHLGSEQHPQLQGQGNRTVLGGDFVEIKPTVPVIVVDAEANTARIQAGSLSGVTEGSVYRLHDPTEREDRPSLKITRVKPFYSDGSFQQGSFQQGDLVVETEHAYGFEPLRISVQADFADGQDKALLERLRGAIQALAGFDPAGDDDARDLVLHILRPNQEKGQYMYASPQHTLPQSFPDQPPEVWVLGPKEQLFNEQLRISLTDADKGIRLLRENLRRLARVREIKQLAARGGRKPPLELGVFLLRPVSQCKSDCEYLFNEEGEEQSYTKTGPHEPAALAELSLKVGDIMTFAIKSQSALPYYAYLLIITEDAGIKAIFPVPEAHQDYARIEAYQTRDLSQEVGLLTDNPGEETLKLIATRKPIDVRLLEMSGYVQRTRSDLNPLERLLVNALHNRRSSPISLGNSEWDTIQVEFKIGQ